MAFMLRQQAVAAAAGQAGEGGGGGAGFSDRAVRDEVMTMLFAGGAWEGGAPSACAQPVGPGRAGERELVGA
jgi:hypothetical protein